MINDRLLILIAIKWYFMAEDIIIYISIKSIHRTFYH